MLNYTVGYLVQAQMSTILETSIMAQCKKWKIIIYLL